MGNNRGNPPYDPLIATRQFDEAANKFRQSLRLRPGDASAQMLLQQAIQGAQQDHPR